MPPSDSTVAAKVGNQSTANWSTLTIFLIVLVEGYVCISSEIICLRQVIPFVGNNIVVTSIVIGTFLLFLALGYQAGGKFNGDIAKKLHRNVFYASIISGIGLSYPVLSMAFVLGNTWFVDAKLLVLLAYTLGIVAPFVYLLAQTLPLMTNMTNHRLRVSEINGQMLFFSTLGSFAGAILTSVVFMMFMGVAFTIFINTLLLQIIVLIIAKRTAAHLRYRFIISLCISLLVFDLKVGFEKTFFVKTDAYNNYRIITPTQVNIEWKKLLSINNSYSSALKKNKQGLAYIELIKKILFKDLKLQGRSILVLGAGGFTLSAESDFGNHFTYVDIDPNIINVVKKHFLNPIRGHFVAEDARVFINKNKRHYDAIVVDAYNHPMSAPVALSTYQFFKKLKTSLNPNGIVIFNIIANPLMLDPFSKHINNTIHAVFPTCAIIPTSYQNKLKNILYVCHVSTPDNLIYTDDKNQVTWDKEML